MTICEAGCRSLIREDTWLVLARVDRLVFGAWEPKTGAVGSLWDVVRDRRLNHRPQVRGGVLAQECAAPLEAFFARQRLG